MSLTSTTRQRAFTIVEVLVAALVMMIVVAGAIYFVAGAGRTQQRSLVRQKLASKADDIAQTLQSSPNLWKDECDAAGGNCIVKDANLVGVSQVPDGPQVRSTIVIEGIDSNADLQGPADRDGIIPDIYQAAITVELADANEVKKWGNVAPVKSVTTLDAASLGLPTGSLEIDACRVRDQVDERMAIDGCSSSTKTSMSPQADCSGSFAISSVVLGCNYAFEDAKAASADYVSVRVDPIPANQLTFTLSRINTDNRESVTKVSSQRSTSSGPNTYVFPNLRAGTYRLTITGTPANTQFWRTKSLPEGDPSSGTGTMTVVVHPNDRANALIMLRPKNTGTHTVKFERVVYQHILKATGWEVGYSSPAPQVFTTSDGTVGSITTTYEYKYLYVDNTENPLVNGPSWPATMAMGSKPYGRVLRTRDEDINETGFSNWEQQKVMPWTPYTGVTTPGTMTFTSLPAGLLSRPVQLECAKCFTPATQALEWLSSNQQPPKQYPGSNWKEYRGTVPAGKDFLWASTSNSNYGDTGTVTKFVDNKTGECYVRSDVPEWKIAPWTLQRTGANSKRCTQTLTPDYFSSSPAFTAVSNFFPIRNNGGGGARLLIGVRASISCSGGCVGGGSGPKETNTACSCGNVVGRPPVPATPATATTKDGAKVSSATNG